MGVAGVLLRGLQVTCTANQDTPLPLWPLFNVDLWEHAFIPDYENRREDYVEAALAIIDWDAASRRFRQRTAGKGE
ncbi:MAG: Fe-Mn family superoxide dismutase [Oscillospiraceae bacterium]